MEHREPCLSKAIAFAMDSGRLILRWYNDDSCRVTKKTDCSPLTSADLESHEYLKNALAGSGIPVISEEEEVPYHTRKTWDRFWLIDPLDGTKDFLQRNGEFTVNIALIENGIPVLGVIHAPEIGLTYYASKGDGAFCVRNGTTRKLPCFAATDLQVATVSRQHLSDTTRRFLASNRISEVRPKGSSLKFGTVASGAANIYPRFEGSMEWDIAAGHAVLSEAGCHIRDLVTGMEPGYNKPSLHNNPFIAYAPHVRYANLIMPDRDIS